MKIVEQASRLSHLGLKCEILIMCMYMYAYLKENICKWGNLGIDKESGDEKVFEVL